MFESTNFGYDRTWTYFWTTGSRTIYWSISGGRLWYVGSCFVYHRIRFVRHVCCYASINMADIWGRDALKVKLGHRRVRLCFLLPHNLCTYTARLQLLVSFTKSSHVWQKLQNEIASFQGITFDQLIATRARTLSVETTQYAGVEGNSTAKDSEHKDKQDTAQISTSTATTKRKYRRHPKVSFSVQVNEIGALSSVPISCSHCISRF